ncbi:hypothetical protein [Streptomyces alkaliphilus]|uniref:hypothetical protein n=1 Tax=Streptomyces alkaliphilus TaxID=1472722 RepID=UPI001E48AA81|nr:hypothetical protein [Streptomyces alkaliphilus]
MDLPGSVGIRVDPLGADLILFSIGNVVTWTYTGYNMLIPYAALQALPADIGEAARVDGAVESPPHHTPPSYSPGRRD